MIALVRSEVASHGDCTGALWKCRELESSLRDSGGSSASSFSSELLEGQAVVCQVVMAFVVILKMDNIDG